jgi:hypothetical protein
MTKTLSNIFIIAIGLILVQSCKTKQVETVQAVTEQVKTSVAVNFTFLQTAQYCGGAAPPEELIKRLETPSPLHKQRLYFKLVGQEEAQWFKHQFDHHKKTIQLESGSYEVYLTSPGTVDDYVSKLGLSDKKCAVKWYSRKLAEFTVDAKSTDKTIILHFDCNPCLTPRP